jgi:hypothetical protein
MTKLIAANPTAEGEGEFPALTGNDYCDHCGYSDNGSGIAQAVVRVVKDGRSFLFCSHHFNIHEPKLFGEGWSTFEDKRAQLTVKPGVSA